MTGVTCAELTSDLRSNGTPRNGSNAVYSVSTPPGQDGYPPVNQNPPPGQKPSAATQPNVGAVPQAQLPAYSMGFAFPDLEAFMRTNSFEADGMFGHAESLPSVYISPTNVRPAKVDSLEFPDAPDILLRDLSGGFESLRGAKLGRDESLGLESMQSIEQSLDEVQKELDAEIAADDRKSTMLNR